MRSLLTDWWFGIDRKKLAFLPQDKVTQDIAVQLMIGARGVSNEFMGRERMVRFHNSGRTGLARAAKLWTIFNRAAYGATAAAYFTMREYERLGVFPSCHKDGQKPRWAVNGCVDSRVQIDSRLAVGSGVLLLEKNVGAVVHKIGNPHELSDNAERWLALAVNPAKSVEAVILSSHGDCGYIKVVSSEPSCGCDPCQPQRLLNGIYYADGFLRDLVYQNGVDSYRNKIVRVGGNDENASDISKLQDALEIANLLHGRKLVEEKLKEWKSDVPVYCVHFGIGGANPHLFLPISERAANPDWEQAIRLTDYQPSRVNGKSNGLSH